MKNLKNWLNKNNFGFEVQKNMLGEEIIFIKVQGLGSENAKKIKTYLKRYKFNFEYRCNYTYILAKKEEEKIYKTFDNSTVQAATKENKINDLSIDNKTNKKELKPIFNTDIEGHEEYQKEELKKYNSGTLNFTHKRINNKMIEEYTKYFIYKDNTFMSVKPGKDYPSGYYDHVKKYDYKIDHVNKVILFTDKEIEEVKPIKEEFYNNNEVEEGKEMKSKEIKELEKKYNVDIKFREFKGKLMYSVFYSPLRNNVTGIFKDIKQLEKQCKSVIIDNRISLTNKINKLENEYLRNI